VCVSWEDAQAYVSWLSSKSGHQFRLPSEAEWEYAARAGTATPYWWGTSIAPHQANYNANIGAAATTPGDRPYTAPVGRFEPNPWGLYQVHGNVWEWVEDCWSTDHAGPAIENRARQGPAACKRVLRGGGWHNGPRGLRSARRHAAKPDFRRSDIGFRVARNL
jgi:formylglycine-generating enzyme required for sulfatase activity